MFGLLLSPSGRINASQFWLGFLVLAIIALALAVGQGFVSQLFLVGFLLAIPYIFVFGKRFHDKGDSIWMALIPLLVAGLAWFAVIGGAGFAVGMEGMSQFAATEGIPESEVFAAMADPDFQARFQVWANDPANASVMEEAAGGYVPILTYGPTLAFWAVSALLGLWVASGKDPEENAHGQPA